MAGENKVYVTNYPVVMSHSESGNVYSMTMQADQTTASGDAEIWNSTTGAKTVIIKALTDISTGEAVIVGWSNIAGDTDVETNVNSAVTSHGTPAGTAYPNQGILSKAYPQLIIQWDGTNPIQRFASQHPAASVVVLGVTIVV